MLLLLVLMPLHSRFISYITHKEEIVAGEEDFARTVIFRIRYFPLQAPTESPLGVLIISLWLLAFCFLL